MTWCGVEGHDEVADRFRASVQQGRLASSFLFIGPSGVGKRFFAMRLAQAFLCERNAVDALLPCLQCDACQQVAAGSHPDVDYVKRIAGKSVLTLDLFIGDRDHRMQEGLCHRISLRPSSGRRRIAIIDDADYFNAPSANCLLKTLEEPPDGAIMILLGTSEQRQLPTIRSRCQIIRFQPLGDDTLKRILVEQQLLPEDILSNDRLLERVTKLAEGSLEKARSLSDPELMNFAVQLERDWKEPNVNSVELATRIRKFVDQAGSEAALRRRRFRQLVELRIRSLRRQLLSAVETESEQNGVSLERVAAKVDRCLQSLQELDANANLATLIECWVDDLCWA